MTTKEMLAWLAIKAPGLSSAQASDLALEIDAAFEVHRKDSLKFLVQENGYLRVYTDSGDSWISLREIANVRHLSIVEVTLRTGEILHIDVTAQELRQFLSAIVPTITK